MTGGTAPRSADRFAVAVHELTIVTVAFEAEFDLLELQARSFAAFLEPDGIVEILVIDNSRAGMGARRRDSLLAAYGALSSRVKVLWNEDVSSVPPAIGWVSQQVLKLRVASRVRTDAYLVLDAKNHLVAAAGVGSVVASGGRPLANFYSYETHPLRKRLEIVLDYFALDREAHIARFTATTTPVVLVTAACIELVSSMEAREQRPFADLFVERGFSEFFLYGAWLESEGVVLDELYDDSGIPTSVVWPGGRDEASVATTIEAARRRGVAFFSVHRSALGRMGPSPTRLVVDFWTERGLFASRADANRFVRRFRLRYARAMTAKRLRKILPSR